MKPERYYLKRLNEYFRFHYGCYEKESEWYTNPVPNKWKCYIPELHLTLLFTCNDDGNVTEQIL